MKKRITLLVGAVAAVMAGLLLMVTTVTDIGAQQRSLRSTLLAALRSSLFVPFKVEGEDLGICNTALVGSANPRIRIESETATFTVTSIIIQPTGTPGTGVEFISINSATIDGRLYTLRSRNLAGGASPVDRGFDIMGVPLQVGTATTDPVNLRGNFPHQIVANNDVDIRLFCRFDLSDVNMARILVSGWKRADDTITLQYVPGS